MTTVTTAKKVTKAPTPEQEPGVIPFFIGSDPEYLLFYGQRGLDASRIITNFFQRDNKFRSTSAGFMIPEVGDFGWDGASSTGELRPLATNNIFKHVEYLGKMLETINSKIPFVDITTLSIGSPIGGHIHVDMFVSKTSTPNNLSTEQRKIVKRAERIMSTFLLPLVASDHRISAMARMSGSYGKVNDFKYEQKTKCVTAEIRGLTAEWLTTPKIATATLAYIACVWHEISKNHEALNKNPHLLRTVNHADSVHRLLLSDYHLISDALVKELKKTVKTFELYPKFKKEIDYIMNPQRVYADKEKVGWNINQGWGFNKNLPRPTKKVLLDTKVIQDMLSKEDIPNIERSFAVSYNDDYNVASFAKAISDRVATMNWPLKHNYALFGFKKGVNGISAMIEGEKFFTLSDNQDKARTMDTCRSMMSRFGSRTSQRYGADRINPKTGKTLGRDSQTIVIGLPYDIRAIDDVAPMIELIWRIENGKVAAKPISEFTVTLEQVNKEAPAQDLDTCVEQYTMSRTNNSDTIEQIINEGYNE